MNTPEKRLQAKGFSPLMEAFKLTPVRKRRTKISLSPVKTPNIASGLARQNSMTFSTHTISKSPLHQYDIPTAALEFEEFSFWTPDGDLSQRYLTNAQEKALREYLHEKYNVVSFWYTLPLLLLGCEGGPPSEDSRPFTIAGAIAIWKSVEELNSFDPLWGDPADGDPLTSLDPEMANEIKELEIPSDEVILWLANDAFPDCTALSVLWDCLVVELPTTSDEEYRGRLETLPGSMLGLPLTLLFYNGPLPNTERRRRIVTPDPKVLAELVADETDYVNTDGKFYPGTMINSVDREGGT
jgi:hypothetical protein